MAQLLYQFIRFIVSVMPGYYHVTEQVNAG